MEGDRGVVDRRSQIERDPSTGDWIGRRPGGDNCGPAGRGVPVNLKPCAIGQRDGRIVGSGLIPEGHVATLPKRNVGVVGLGVVPKKDVAGPILLDDMGAVGPRAAEELEAIATGVGFQKDLGMVVAFLK